ncbi:uncharacterized protein LOC124449140 [Xenia sp. Carnegie-2017]|uniref:uncharacterized protein LOC124449140 n=1 Tax=Xenia sp. Carnegie-2017 TaxID=2897299 RepID=UPI001F04E86D|nr:uncharacterized protein LOC124449140 [Xenia sp. Carnegie-2017]
MAREIDERITSAWKRFGQYSMFMRDQRMPMCLKRKIMDTVILLAMTYGAETWALTNHQREKLAITQRSMERSMLGVTRRDKIRNEDLRARTKVKDVIEKVIEAKGKKDEVVKIKIGIIELDGKRLKIRRSSLLPVDVRKSDTLVPVKNAGVQKQLAHNRHLRDHNETEWLLLYPDMDIVGNIPGSSEKFSVEKYKNELGRPYSRVNLYICKMLDFEVANDLTEDLEETVVPDTADVFEDNSVQENSSQIICELGNSQQVNATPDNFVEVNHAHTNAVPASLAKASLVEASHVQTNPVPSNVVNVDNSCVEAVSFQVDSFSVEQIIMEPGEMPAQIFQDADVTESLLDNIEPEPNLVQPAQVNLPRNNCMC